MDHKIIKLVGDDVVILKPQVGGDFTMRVLSPGVSDGAVYVPAQSVYLSLSKDAIDDMISTFIAHRIQQGSFQGVARREVIAGIEFVIERDAKGRRKIVGAQSL